MPTVKSQIEVDTSTAQAYRAFTNATNLVEWMCNVATVEPRQNGRIYLWWTGDFYSSGHYFEVEENKSVKFRWFSNIDPAPTEVEVTFEESAGKTLVVLSHLAPDGDGWNERANGFKGHWDHSLPNLKSVLETGIDLRIANRPMLGFAPGDFTKEQAMQLGIPVQEGVRLDGVLDGMGAAEAGLQKDDVIVNIEGHEIKSDFSSFQQAIAGKQGGDRIEVTFYRGPEKKTVSMVLSRRPMPEVPFDTAELARQGQERYDAVMTELASCLEGATDEQAATRPAVNEWSALEIIAHLLHTERFYQQYITECIGGFVRSADGFGGNIDAQVKATVSVFPTIASMMDALSKCIKENLNLVANMPAEITKTKGSFYRVGSTILQDSFHFQTHFPQIRAALAAAQN